STRQSSSGSSWDAWGSARQLRVAGSENLSVVIVQQIEILGKTGPMPLALGEFALRLRGQVGQAQGSVLDEGVDQVFEDADKVRVQPGKTVVVAGGHGQGVRAGPCRPARTSAAWRRCCRSPLRALGATHRARASCTA